ncbi:MAG TPA: EAL domain-containing protein [Acidimicrobiales bacterium]
MNRPAAQPNRHPLAIAATVLYVLIAWLLRVVAGSNTTAGVVSLVLSTAVPLTVVALTIRTARRLRSRTWWTFAVAGALWVVASVIGEVLEVVRGGSTYPSPAEALFLVVMAILLTATWRFSHSGATRREKLRSLFDGLVIAAALMLVFWSVVLGPAKTDELGTIGSVLITVYVVCDILVVTTVQSSREFLRPESVGLRLLARAFVVFGVADALFAYQVSTDSYGQPWLPDLGWLAAFAMLGWAAYLGGEASGSEVRRRVRNLQLNGAVAAASAAVAVSIVVNGGLTANQAWCVLVVVVVGAARQYFAQTENDELQRRLERQLVARSQSEARFRNVFDGLSDGVAVVTADAHIKEANAALAEMLGVPRDALIGIDAMSLIASEDRERLSRNDWLLDKRSLVTVRARTASGRSIPIEINVADLVDDPAVGGFVITTRDISERLARERELSESKERFRRAFEAAPIGMLLVASDGRIIAANEAFARMLGRCVDELVGASVESTTHPDDVEAEQRRIRELLESDAATAQWEKRLVRADGRQVWVSVTVSVVRLPSGAHELVKQIEDITERRQVLAQLAYMARYDALTGLANRAHFEERLAEALTVASRQGERVAVAFFDVDRFKVINDTLGHRHGDELLRVVAARLVEATREEDTVARFGGDEFTAVFRGVRDEAEARAIVQRVTEHVCRPIEFGGGETFVSLSVGLALSSPNMDASAVDHLLRDADAAMYRAKGAGRGRVEVHVDGSSVSSVNLLRLSNDLHRAQERGELDVHYQPMVRLDDGHIRTLEALLRWRHPQLGMVTPSQFLPLAEDTGLVVPIGAWVFETVCQQMVEWNAALRATKRPPLRATVNVSSRQLDVEGFSDTVARILARTGADPDWMWLEITEGALMRDTTDTISTLRRLRDLGVHLAIDDFGTGYSSLAYLRRFPVEALKIDRSFVAGLGENDEDTTIVRAIVDLAHALGLFAVAEGVETEAQRDELERIGCELAQGWLFAAAAPASAITDPAAVTGWPSVSGSAALR